MEAFDQKTAIQEIVDYWTKSKLDDESRRNVKLTEEDVVSLFQVLDGHFLLKTGVEARDPAPPEVKPLNNCEDCGRMFDKAWALERHKQIHLNTERFPCSQCDRKFLSSAGLTKHLSKHSQPAQCPEVECGKQFTTKQYLDQHLQTHHLVVPL